MQIELTRTLNCVPDGAAVPAASTGSPDPASVQGICDPFERHEASPADLLDHRQDPGGVFVRHDPPPVGTGLGDLDHIRVAQTLAPVLLRLEGLTGPVGDQTAFLLGQGRPEVEGERIDIEPKLGDNELDPVPHQPADEVHVSAEAVELGDDHGALLPLGSCDGGVEPRTVVVSTGHHIAEEVGDDIAVAASEASDGILLGIKAKSSAALLAGGDPDITDALHMPLHRQIQIQEERIVFVF